MLKSSLVTIGIVFSCSRLVFSLLFFEENIEQNSIRFSDALQSNKDFASYKLQSLKLAKNYTKAIQNHDLTPAHKDTDEDFLYYVFNFGATCDLSVTMTVGVKEGTCFKDDNLSFAVRSAEACNSLDVTFFLDSNCQSPVLSGSVPNFSDCFALRGAQGTEFESVRGGCLARDSPLKFDKDVVVTSTFAADDASCENNPVSFTAYTVSNNSSKVGSEHILRAVWNTFGYKFTWSDNTDQPIDVDEIDYHLGEMNQCVAQDEAEQDDKSVQHRDDDPMFFGKDEEDYNPTDDISFLNESNNDEHQDADGLDVSPVPQTPGANGTQHLRGRALASANKGLGGTGAAYTAWQQEQEMVGAKNVVDKEYFKTNVVRAGKPLSFN